MQTLLTKTSTSRNLALFVAIIVLAQGCASRSPINQLAPGSDLYLVESSQEDRTKSVSTANMAVPEMTGEGAMEGAWGGAALGLTCGPWFFICMPFGMVAGAAVGSTTGLIVGAASDMSSASKETISQKLLEAIEVDHPDVAIGKQLKQISSPQLNIVETEVANRLEIRLAMLQLHSHADRGASLFIRVQAQLSYLDKQGEAQVKTGFFDYNSQAVQLNNWLYAGPEFYQSMLSTGYQVLAGQILDAMIVIPD